MLKGAWERANEQRMSSAITSDTHDTGRAHTFPLPLPSPSDSRERGEPNGVIENVKQQFALITVLNMNTQIDVFVWKTPLIELFRNPCGDFSAELPNNNKFPHRWRRNFVVDDK